MDDLLHEATTNGIESELPLADPDSLQSRWVTPRKDTRARFVKKGILPPVYYFQSGQVRSNRGLDSKTYKRLLERQREKPVVVVKGRVEASTWWMFEDEFYWDDRGYTADEIKATVLTQRFRLHPFNQHVEMLLLIWKAEEYKKQVIELKKQFDELHLRMTELQRQAQTIVKRGENTVDLVQWLDSHTTAGLPLAVAEIEDQMLRLGFTDEDVREFGKTPAPDLTSRLDRWLQSAMNAAQAQQDASLERMNSVSASMQAIAEKTASVAAQHDAVRARLDAVSAETAQESGTTATVSGEREPIPEWLRRAVLARDNFVCRYCGQRAQSLDVDHVIPVSQGGRSTFDNLVTACLKCNRKKGGHTPEEAGMELLPPGTLRRQ